MSRRIKVSPATREALLHDPRPKTHCPRHGPFYPKENCPQCKYEKDHPDLQSPSVQSEYTQGREG